MRGRITVATLALILGLLATGATTPQVASAKAKAGNERTTSTTKQGVNQVKANTNPCRGVCARRVERRQARERLFKRTGCITRPCFKRVCKLDCKKRMALAERKRKVRAQTARLLVYPGPDGRRWAIPWHIVNCESGGSWGAANPSGAAGPYQIMAMHGRPWPATTPAAQLAHHQIAARLWRGGAGKSNWVCR